jgi:hypothetical protein
VISHVNIELKVNDSETGFGSVIRVDINRCQLTLTIGTEPFSETLVFNSALTGLIAREVL